MNPDGGLAGRRVHAVAAVGPRDEPGGGHGEHVSSVGDPLADDGPANLQAVVVRAEADLVVNPHLRHDQAQLAGDPVADRPQTVEQVAAARRLGQGDESVADLQFERIDV